jgi:hypothetical protein
VETYSSLKFDASLKAFSSSFEAASERCAWLAPLPETFGSLPISRVASACTAGTCKAHPLQQGATMPSRSSSSAASM